LIAGERSAAVRNLAYPDKPSLTFFARYPYFFILTIFLFSVCWWLTSLSSNKGGNKLS
jgi:hypothetical protein